MKTKIYKKLLAGCLSAALVGTLVLAPAAPVSLAAETEEFAEDAADEISSDAEDESDEGISYSVSSSDESAFLGDDDEEADDFDDFGDDDPSDSEGDLDDTDDGDTDPDTGSETDISGEDTGNPEGDVTDITDPEPEYKDVTPSYTISMVKTTVEYEGEDDDPEFEITYPEGVDEVDEAHLKLSSSNTKVAKFDDEGSLEIVGIGKATFTVSNDAYTDEEALIRFKPHSAKSKELTVIPARTESIKVSALSNGIKISWEEVPGAATYSIYRSGTTQAIKTGIKTLTYTDTKAASGKSYTYQVVASANKQTGKKSSKSKSVKWVKKTNTSSKKTTLGKPSKVKTSSKKSKTLTVSWKAATGAKKYQVQYSTKSSFAGAKTKSASGTSLTISKLKGKTVYYVRVRAVSGKSYSDWVSAKKVTVKK